MRDVTFTSRDVAEHTKPHPGWVVISITDPRQPLAKIQEGWHAVLRVQFFDTGVPMTNPIAPLIMEKYPPITPATAEKIAMFILQHQDKNFLVHCEAGISRSAGVAMAIHDTVGHPLRIMDRYDFMNSYVHQLVYCALEVIASPPCVKYADECD